MLIFPKSRKNEKKIIQLFLCRENYENSRFGIIPDSPDFLDGRDKGVYNIVIKRMREGGEMLKKTVVRQSAIPILGIGAVWLLYGLIFPLYRPWHLLFPILLSIGAFLILKKMFPGRSITVEVPETTGNEALDAMILEGKQALKKIRDLNRAIPDEKLSAQMDEMEDLTGKIFETVREDPGKLPQIRRFMNYYLPTTLKLLEQYSVLQDRAKQSGNVSQALGKIEGAMDTILSAFRRQLDGLYQKEVVDITADVQVLEQMLASQDWNTKEKTQTK